MDLDWEKIKKGYGFDSERCGHVIYDDYDDSENVICRLKYFPEMFVLCKKSELERREDLDEVQL